MTRTDTQPQHANPATRAVLLCAVFAFFGLGVVAATLRESDRKLRGAL